MRPDLDLAALHELEHLLGVAGADDELDAGMRLGEAVEERRERVGRDRGRGAERELAALAAPERVHEPASLGDGLDGALRKGEERAARLGQLDAAAPPHEELRADPPLERVQPRGQGGLGDEERARRFGDAALARHGDEPFELGQHTKILSKYHQNVLDVMGVRPYREWIGRLSQGGAR